MKKIFKISIPVLILDQIVKIIISYFLELGTKIEIIKNFFHITYVMNDGAAWSMFSGQTVFLIIFSIIALNIIYIFFIHNQNLNKLEELSYGLLIGGILGNLVDRIVYGKVVDYLDFNIFGYDFPVFNIADICICLSVFILIINLIRGEINERNSGK